MLNSGNEQAEYDEEDYEAALDRILEERLNKITAFLRGDVTLKEEIQTLLVGLTEYNIDTLCRLTLERSTPDDYDKIVDLFNVFPNYKNKLSLLQHLIDYSEKYPDVSRKIMGKYIESFSDQPVFVFDESFLNRLASHQDFDTLFDLVFQNADEENRRHIFEYLLERGNEYENAILLQNLAKKEPYYSEAVNRLSIGDDRKKIMESIVSLSPQNAAIYTECMNQFTQGFGNIKEDGGLLRTVEVNQRKKNDKREEQDKKPYLFDPTILEMSEFESYLQTLKSATPPIRERFAISGAHWICGDISIDKTGKAKMLIIDSLGINKAENEPGEEVLKVVSTCSALFSNPDIYFDPTQRQNAMAGCSVFALDDVRHLYTIEQFLPGKSDLFQYLEKGVKGTIDNDGTTIKTTNLPLPLMRTAQTSTLINEKPGRARIMFDRPIEERAIPLGRQKSTANEFIQRKEGFAMEGEGLEAKLANRRLEKKLNDMEHDVREFILSNPSNLEREMQKFSLSGLSERLAEKAALRARGKASLAATSTVATFPSKAESPPLLFQRHIHSTPAAITHDETPKEKLVQTLKEIANEIKNPQDGSPNQRALGIANLIVTATNSILETDDHQEIEGTINHLKEDVNNILSQRSGVSQGSALDEVVSHVDAIYNQFQTETQVQKSHLHR